jgi:hypothetical protein
MQGLLGSNSGQVNDFQLPDGTILPQPLLEGELLGQFAGAWRVTPGTSLLDLPPAATTAIYPASVQVAARPLFIPSATVPDTGESTLVGSLQLSPQSPEVAMRGTWNVLVGDTISDIGPNDWIDITYLPIAGTFATWTTAGSQWDLRLSTQAMAADLHFIARPGAANVVISSDGIRGTLLRLT